MTHINHRRTGALALVLGLSVTASAGAQGWHGMGEGGRGMFGLLEGVTLTDAQQLQVRADMKAGHAASHATMEALHAVDEQIATLMTSSGSVSEASVMPLVQQQEALRAQLDQQRVAVALQVRSVLTASQLSQAAAAHGQLEALHEKEMAIARPDVPPPAP